MNYKKIGLTFVVIGILAISSFLIYPFLNEKTEKAIPVLKGFSDSNISGNENTENSYSDNSEIWEKSDDKLPAEVSMSTDTMQPETVSAIIFPIDINAASAEELMHIKGIGKVLAENIVSYRENYGYFYSVEDLMNVDGIGDKKLEAIKDYVYIDREIFPETTAVQDDVFTSEYTSAPVTTVPQSYSSVHPKQTSVKTTVTAAAETEDTDDGIIIEEITDFEDFTQTEDYSITVNDKTTDFSFSDVETTSDEYYPNFPLELNTASAKDLTYINGIGEALAERIVEYARSHGFYDVNDLLNVSGIGQSKLNSILPYVYADASGLPPKTETTVTDYYDDPWVGSDTTAYTFPSETTSAAPEIYSVNVNTATKADFMQLPGIDETLADNIIFLRDQIGYFATIEELSLADGMTNSKLSAIWNYIYV